MPRVHGVNSEDKVIKTRGKAESKLKEQINRQKIIEEYVLLKYTSTKVNKECTLSTQRNAMLRVHGSSREEHGKRDGVIAKRGIQKHYKTQDYSLIKHIYTKL